MRISDWSSDVCSSDLKLRPVDCHREHQDDVSSPRIVDFDDERIRKVVRAMAAMQPGIYSLQQGMCEVGPTDVPKQLGASAADPIGDWRQQLDPTFEPAHDLTAQKQSIPARFALGPPFEDENGRASCRERGCKDV